MKVVFWLFVAIGLVYVFYSGAIAAYQYVQVKDVVEESVLERSKLDKYDRATRVKQDILRKLPAAGVTLGEGNVLVSEEERSLRVLIRWSYPVVVYQDHAYLSIPISYDKSFQVASGR
jgi:hypothetical protein